MLMSYTENSKKVFLNTGTRFQRSIIWAMGAVKMASARANVILGVMNEKMGQAIEKAALEVMDGLHDEEIIVDVFQTGSGTGINMNVNEVISKRATEILGSKVHPNDHVNMSQSSNDVVPTAIRVAAVRDTYLYLLPSLKQLVESLTNLSQRTSEVYKPGRTHLRDALPVTMGQEFGAYAAAFDRDSGTIASALDDVKKLPIGGTAVGTGVNAPPGFSRVAVEELNKITKLSFEAAENRFMRMRLLTDLVNLSGAIRGTAIDLYRISQDLRLMFSGPMTAINEIDIPTQEEVAGSSIMPGKTNPVTVESCLQSSVQIMGIDHAIQLAGMLGEFELSMGVPLTGYDIILEISLLSESLTKMAKVVIDNVVPNTERARRLAESSPSLITITSPYIGYDKASKIGKQLARGLSIRDALKELGYKDEEIDAMLDLKKLVTGNLTK